MSPASGAAQQTGPSPASQQELPRAQTAQMVESIHAAVAFARRGGASVARISLQPRELGDVSVHLAQTAQGLVARLTASTPAGAQALVQARAELHRSLSELGTTLLRLDVGANEQQQQRTAGEQPAGSTLTAARAGEPDSAAAGEQGVEAPVGRLAQAKGVQVDVLA